MIFKVELTIQSCFLCDFKCSCVLVSPAAFLRDEPVLTDHTEAVDVFSCTLGFSVK